MTIIEQNEEIKGTKSFFNNGLSKPKRNSGGIISGPVGNRLENKESDVRIIKRKFKNLNRLDEDEEAVERGIITAPLTEAVKKFQKEKNLKQDGLIYPKGETENALEEEETDIKKRVYKKMQEQGINEGDRKSIKENLINTPIFLHSADYAKSKTKVLFENKNRGSLADNDADAFRHALWNYRMTKMMGEKNAKHFADGHENIPNNPKGSKEMDLFNNAVGRALAKNPKNKSKKDIDVILEALKKGQLQIKPKEE